MKELDYWIWLSSLSILPYKKYQLINAFETPEKIFKLDKRELLSKVMLSKEDFAEMDAKKDFAMIHRYKDYINTHGVFLISFNDARYPQNLRNIFDPPMVLFAKGNLDLLKQKCLAIVGSRNSNSYGNAVSYHFGKEISKNGITIVSGLAKGIDKMAHLGALSETGKTIAILGNGMDIVYPSENQFLYEQIFKEGLILTEFIMGTRPNAIHFPMRNRLISGLGEGLLVVQASHNSGSLITANFALEQGKEVYAIPGNINDPLSEGTNRLIQDGAKMVLEIGDILTDFQLE